MNLDTLDNILYVIGAAGGVVFVITPFLSGFRASSSRHFCVAIFVAGLTAIAWAILGLEIHQFHPNISPNALHQLHRYKDMCSGATLGILLVGIVSGEFLNAYRRDRELRKLRPKAAPAAV